MKSGFCAIVGRPSAGKSTLVNALTGHKVSIVSSTPQTTRNKVRGIVSRPGAQAVLLDTPGIHLSDKKFNKYMMENVGAALDEADVILYVLDATRAPGVEEAAIRQRLEHRPAPLVVALNKTDQAAHEAGAHREALAALKPVAVVEISALTKKGLDSLWSALEAALPEGPAYYPDEYYTDQDPHFRCAELIREAALAHVREELPHALYVEIADLEVRDDEQTLWVRAFLTVERESQIGILVGHGGKTIKAIRVEAVRQLNRIFSQKVDLDLRVKVNNKWKGDDALLRRLVLPKDQ